MFLRPGAGPRALGLAACGVSVYTARTLGLRGGVTPVNHTKKHSGTLLSSSGSDGCCGCHG